MHYFTLHNVCNDTCPAVAQGGVELICLLHIYVNSVNLKFYNNMKSAGGRR